MLVIMTSHDVANSKLRPVFLHGYQGGGTGILWNLITSHPSCLGPRLETNELFLFGFSRFAKALLKRRGYQVRNMLALVRLGVRHGFDPRAFRAFSLEDLNPRDGDRLRSHAFRSAVIGRLHELKVDHAVRPGLDLEDYKTPTRRYRPEEIETTRLTAKNLEGCCFLRDFLREIYIEPRFVSIVRDGLAVCESNLRHGRAASATDAGRRYRVIASELLRQSEDDDSLLVRYEDLVANPREFISTLYDFLGIDLDPDQMFRMAVREFVGREGTWLGKHQVQKGKNWMTLGELTERFLQKDINKRALQRLSASDRKQFLAECRDIEKTLGYL